MSNNLIYSNSNQEVLNEFNAQKNHNIKPTINDNLKKECQSPVNNLYQLLYGRERIETFREKEIIANQFFADLIDGNSIQWIVNLKGNRSEDLEKLLVKYLLKTDFAIKLWQTKFKSGIYGKYGMAIVKKELDQASFDETKKTIPQLIPVSVIYKNQTNDNLFETEVALEGFNYDNGKTSLAFHKHYSLHNNVVSIDSSLVNLNTGEKVEDSDLSDTLRENIDLSSETFDEPFIPVSILINNYDETTRISKVASRLEMLDKFDEVLATLPAWEKGSINFTASPVSPQNSSNQNVELMKNILLKGFNEFKLINTDGNLQNLAENLILLKPKSIMKTTKATRDLIWTEIKEDLGLPTLSDVKSTPKTNTKAVAKQFLTSPIIDREKVFLKSFLKDLAKKFLVVLSTCEIDDKMPSFEIEDLEIDLEFDLTTERNINQTIKQMHDDSSLKDIKESAKEIEKDSKGLKQDDRNLRRRIRAWFSRR